MTHGASETNMTIPDLGTPTAPEPMDSRTVLTIGDESFPVVRRRKLEEECPNGHWLYFVETETAGDFKVCDTCATSQWVRPE